MSKLVLVMLILSLLGCTSSSVRNNVPTGVPKADVFIWGDTPVENTSLANWWKKEAVCPEKPSSSAKSSYAAFHRRFWYEMEMAKYQFGRGSTQEAVHHAEKAYEMQRWSPYPPGNEADYDAARELARILRAAAADVSRRGK